MILKLHNISGVFIEETKLKKLRTFNIVIGSWIVILINLNTFNFSPLHIFKNNYYNNKCLLS